MVCKSNKAKQRSIRPPVVCVYFANFATAAFSHWQGLARKHAQQSRLAKFWCTKQNRKFQALVIWALFQCISQVVVLKHALFKYKSLTLVVKSCALLFLCWRRVVRRMRIILKHLLQLWGENLGRRWRSQRAIVCETVLVLLRHLFSILSSRWEAIF